MLLAGCGLRSEPARLEAPIATNEHRAELEQLLGRPPGGSRFAGLGDLGGVEGTSPMPVFTSRPMPTRAPDRDPDGVVVEPPPELPPFDPCARLRVETLPTALACSLPEVAPGAAASGSPMPTLEDVSFDLAFLSSWFGPVGPAPSLRARPPTQRRYSFAYSSSANVVYYDPELFRAQLAMCGEPCRGRTRPILFGNLSHELGHWTLAQRSAANDLLAFCEARGSRIVQPVDGPPSPAQWAELYADFVAGRLLGRTDGGPALATFFAGIARAGEGPHPRAVLRNRAIEVGAELGAEDRQRALGPSAAGGT